MQILGARRILQYRADQESYFRCLCRLLPSWPRHRALELSPRDWNKTRPRLRDDQMEPSYGYIDIPPPPRPATGPAPLFPTGLAKRIRHDERGPNRGASGGCRLRSDIRARSGLERSP